MSKRIFLLTLMLICGCGHYSSSSDLIINIESYNLGKLIELEVDFYNEVAVKPKCFSLGRSHNNSEEIYQFAMERSKEIVDAALNKIENKKE